MDVLISIIYLNTRTSIAIKNKLEIYHTSVPYYNLKK